MTVPDLRHRRDTTTGARGFAIPSRRTLIAVWLLAAAALGAVLIASRILRTPGDDSDPGRQRPGILDLGSLPEPAPSLPGLELPAGQRAVVFFARPDRAGRLCESLERDHQLDGEVVVVVTGAATPPCPGDVRVVVADTRRIANRFGLPTTRGGVPPTGYAIVDSRGQLRYRTLDPLAPRLLDEATTMLRAVP